MNEHDSEIMAGLLLSNGYRQASSRDEADIVIFNTCSIRENADKRFFGTLGQLKHRKEQEKEELYRLRMRLYDAAAAYHRYPQG